MKKCFKKASVILLSALVFAQGLGIYKIYAFAKNMENNASVFSANSDQAFEGVKHNEKTQNTAKRSAQSILDNRVKFKTSEFSGEENKIVCYTKNVYLELDTNSMQPVFYFYECKYGKPKISREECERIAKTFVFRNMPRKARATDADIYCDSFDDVAEFRVAFSEGIAFVAIRRDNGRIIYYDASELF